MLALENPDVGFPGSGWVRAGGFEGAGVGLAMYSRFLACGGRCWLGHPSMLIVVSVRGSW